LEAFYDKVDEFVAFVKSSPCAPGFSEILLPGESGRRREAQNRKEGVEIDESTWAGLIQLATELKVTKVPAPL
jgi:LDH2 family malate/lactate/ureidoglycolate dehydrogenase